LLASRRKLNARPVRVRGRRASNKQHLRAVCSPERHSLASECAACKAAGNSSSTAASPRMTTRMQARWLARMVTSEHCSRRTPKAVPKGRGCRGCNATTEQFPPSKTPLRCRFYLLRYDCTGIESASSTGAEEFEQHYCTMAYRGQP